METKNSIQPILNEVSASWAAPTHAHPQGFEGFGGAQPSSFGTAGVWPAVAAATAFPEAMWEDPIPLPVGLTPVLPFNSAYLPEGIDRWIMDIADRMQCPPDFPAATAIVALGSVIGRQIRVRPKLNDSWAEAPNVWGLIVGRPGVMKSPAMSEALVPLKRLEAKARENYSVVEREFQAEMHKHKLRRNAIDEQAKKSLKNNIKADIDFGEMHDPVEPKPRRYLISDATYEALGDILSYNQNGILTYRDEIIALLKTLDREEQAAARGFFLTAWNGNDSYIFDRIGRGHQYLEAVCVSMLGSTQPGKLGSYIGRALKGGDGDDGLIQRFGVLVWPDTNGPWRVVDRYPDSQAKDQAHRMFEWLASPNWDHVRPNIDTHDNTRYLTLDPHAYEMFIGWLSNLEWRLRSEALHVVMESHIAKYRKLVPSLALINHMASTAQGPVTALAMKKAIDYAAYLESHANRAYRAGLMNDATAGSAILSRIKKGELSEGFTQRDIHQRDWSNLTDRKQVQSGLELLVDCNWLRPTEIATGGRPKTIYGINPKVWM